MPAFGVNNGVIVIGALSPVYLFLNNECDTGMGQFAPYGVNVSLFMMPSLFCSYTIEPDACIVFV
jgi:hypothetical protein